MSISKNIFRRFVDGTYAKFAIGPSQYPNRWPLFETCLNGNQLDPSLCSKKLI